MTGPVTDAWLRYEHFWYFIAGFFAVCAAVVTGATLFIAWKVRGLSGKQS